jgi:hypothetical protein
MMQGVGGLNVRLITSILNGCFSGDGRMSAFSDHLGLVHVFGFGEALDVPKEQFFKSDWEATRSINGVVVDDATGVEVCFMETGPIVDMAMEVHERQPDGLFNEVDCGMIEEAKIKREVKALGQRGRMRMEIEFAAPTNEAHELARRKKLMTAVARIYLPEPVFVVPAMGIDELNDSDYEGDGGRGANDAVDDEEDEEVEFIVFLSPLNPRRRDGMCLMVIILVAMKREKGLEEELEPWLHARLDLDRHSRKTIYHVDRREPRVLVVVNLQDRYLEGTRQLTRMSLIIWKCLVMIIGLLYRLGMYLEGKRGKRMLITRSRRMRLS